MIAREISMILITSRQTCEAFFAYCVSSVVYRNVPCMCILYIVPCMRIWHVYHIICVHYMWIACVYCVCILDVYGMCILYMHIACVHCICILHCILRGDIPCVYFMWIWYMYIAYVYCMCILHCSLHIVMHVYIAYLFGICLLHMYSYCRSILHISCE
jgi:hypothetical protein